MDFLQLQHFLAVAELGSFTRAAERAFRTQPAISQSIRRLESEIGLALFVRDIHDVALTESGTRLADYARRMLNLRAEALGALADLRHLAAGSVSIGTFESALLYLLPGPIGLYGARFPEVRIDVRRSLTANIPREVLDREIDVGITRNEPPFAELEWRDIYSDRMVLVASPSHRLTGRPEVEVEELGRERFYTHYPSDVITENVLPIFDRCRTPMHVAAQLWSFPTIKHFVREGLGLTIVPWLTVHRELANGLLVEIPVHGLDVVRRNIMIFRTRQYLSEPARRLITLIADFDWSGWLSTRKTGIEPIDDTP